MIGRVMLITGARAKDKVTVVQIAKTVSEEMNAPNIEYKFTGGVDGGRGWKGDVKIMQLSIDKLVRTGWKPNHSSKQAVKLAAKALIHLEQPGKDKNTWKKH